MNRPMSMGPAADAQARSQAALTQLEQHYWQADVKSALRYVVARRASADIYDDLTDLAKLAMLRNPGITPPQVEGLTFSERTIPNMAGDHEIPVRLYIPDKRHALRPAYVLFHGGGLSFGSLNTEHPRCIELTRSCGAIGVSVGYRLAPEHPPDVIMDDCYSALYWTIENAGDLGIDARRVAITGSGGGGMMTLSIAQMARDRGDVAPVAQLALYPSTDDWGLDPHVSRHQKFGFIDSRSINSAMKNLRAHGPCPPYIIPNQMLELSGLCPATVIVAGNDPLRDEAIDYASRMIREGVPTGLHVIPGVAHAFDIWAPECAATKQAYGLMNEAFLRAAAEVEG